MTNYLSQVPATKYKCPIVDVSFSRVRLSPKYFSTNIGMADAGGGWCRGGKRSVVEGIPFIVNKKKCHCKLICLKSVHFKYI